MIIFWIIIAIIIFSLIILIHEFWHFFTARFFWVKVEEFGLWIPPKAKKIFKDKKDTIYTLNWLPLWWFVRLSWEDWEKKDLSDKTKFYNKNYFQKSIILLAWVFMNFLLAWIIFSILFLIWIKPLWINNQIPIKSESKIVPTYNQAIKNWLLIKKEWLVLNPIENSLAENTWIKTWDILIKINWEKINNYEELKEILNKNKNSQVKLKIERYINKNKKEIHNEIIKLDETWKIWAYIWDNIEINEKFEYNFSFIESIKYWFYETYVQSVLTIKWLSILIWDIFTPETQEKREEALDNVSWPIWIVDFVSNNAKHGIIFLSIITAIISINLWIFNLLPIPALDWWRFLLLTINTILNKIFKWKVNMDKFENSLHIIFFISLIALSIFIWYNDVEKIINR